VQQNNGHKWIVALYVDDGIVAAIHSEDSCECLRKLKTEFKITAGPVSCFLGIEVKQFEDGSIFISQ